MEINEDQITKGFNAGYLLQKFEPELAQTLMAGLQGVELPYFEGVMAGAKQFPPCLVLSPSRLSTDVCVV